MSIPWRATVFKHNRPGFCGIHDSLHATARNSSIYDGRTSIDGSLRDVSDQVTNGDALQASMVIDLRIVAGELTAGETTANAGLIEGLHATPAGATPERCHWADMCLSST
jgi:hypothetical protein